MDLARVALIGLVVAGGMAPVSHADVLLNANDLAMRVTVAARDPPGAQTRALTIVHLAMFDAANGVERRYTPYLTPAPAPSGASAAAAMLGAACAALQTLYPAQRASIEAECSTMGAAVAGADPGSPALRYGEAIGIAHVDARKGDGFGAPNAWRPATSPGVFVPTVLPAGYDVRVARPFALREPAQFRPGPPPRLDGEAWARDYNEVRVLGGRRSAQRTTDQAAVATFWAPSGIVVFNPLLRQAVAAAGTTPVERARFLALAMVAAADASIAVFDAKYAYNFWRPLTAIRNGDIDGNDATEQEAEWMPLIDAPPHPEYPCAHCITASAVTEVMASALGWNALSSPLVMSAQGAPAANTAPRSWKDVGAIPVEVANSRVWAGIHYRNSTEVGNAMGRSVGRWVLERILLPQTGK